MVRTFISVKSGFMFNTYGHVFTCFQKIRLELTELKPASPKWWERRNVAELLWWFFSFSEAKLIPTERKKPFKNMVICVNHIHWKEKKTECKFQQYDFQFQTKQISSGQFFIRNSKSSPLPTYDNIAFIDNARFNPRFWTLSNPWFEFKILANHQENFNFLVITFHKN